MLQFTVQADLSPSVSPCGKKIAVASFQKKAGWNGEIEDLKTDIFVMNLEKPYKRHLVVDNGGWPTWGSDNIIFFHRKVGDFWGVFRADIGNGLTSRCTLVTPENIDAMTPAAIDATTVAVAINRPYSSRGHVPHEKNKYRHIEIHDSSQTKAPIQITERYRTTIDHFNPFVFMDGGKKHIGYHRCKHELLKVCIDCELINFIYLFRIHPVTGDACTLFATNRTKNIPWKSGFIRSNLHNRM